MRLKKLYFLNILIVSMNTTFVSLVLNRVLLQTPLFTVRNHDRLVVNTAKFTRLFAPLLHSSHRHYNVALRNLLVKDVTAESAILLSDCMRITDTPIVLTDSDSKCFLVENSKFENHQTAITSSVSIPIIISNVEFIQCAKALSITNSPLNISDIVASGCTAEQGSFAQLINLKSKSEITNCTIKDCATPVLSMSGLHISITGLTVETSTGTASLLTITSCLAVSLTDSHFIAKDDQIGLEATATGAISLSKCTFNSFSGHFIQLTNSYVAVSDTCFMKDTIQEAVSVSSGDLKIFVSTGNIVFGSKCQLEPKLTETEQPYNNYGVITISVFITLFMLLFIVFAALIFSKVGDTKVTTYTMGEKEKIEFDDSISSDNG